MSEPILHRAAMADLLELQERLPVAGDLVFKTMAIQPDLDPDAGDGVFQCLHLLLDLKLPDDRLLKMVELCRYNEWNLYIVVRSIYYKALMEEEFETHFLLSTPFRVVPLLDTLCSFVPSFDKSLALKNVAVD